MKKVFLGLVVGVLFSVPALACLNGTTKILANGTLLYEDYEGFVPHGHEFGSAEHLKEILISLEKGYAKTKDMDYLSDKGYILVIQGKYQEAIELYKKIESIEPGRYSTASNIGTAYELTGNNLEALKWIEKSINISSKSHFYSEWIHVNILKAKIKGEKYITSGFLIGKDFGKDSFPKSDMDNDSLEALRQQLYFQLNERMFFVKPEDKIVARLLFDLGNLSYLLGDRDEATENYKLAKEYGFHDPVLKERMKFYSPPVIEHVEKKVVKEIKFQTKKSRRSQLMGIIVSVFALFFSGLIIFIFRKKIFPKLIS
ncbi:tetratricopeptide (TPR) repeat protein [Chryseobacterium defluvii]|uniref:Tetratricopeptide (TPR) repeat protein n=1 Tax=Chryseobacterium defluvii TaxID=160396 RepID=A0A840KCS0_9FLAO|nr:tetratricopeptide repeat protein [Chryseobacterium defluvii]MBB4805797.1 tetratricopeptide (TPR) repeat protein [Chryseobacterium defluvii]